MAIAHGMDSVRYPYLYADFENDATHTDIQVDHNRCILCLRCIRVCAEKVGTHTLDLQKRGWNATIVTDLGRKLGESSTCTTCGACAQVCPTGTITLREFAYRGRRKDCDSVVESVCPCVPSGAGSRLTFALAVLPGWRELQSTNPTEDSFATRDAGPCRDQRNGRGYLSL